MFIPHFGYLKLWKAEVADFYSFVEQNFPPERGV